ncbi:unnamed protein product [Amoebophrya sp. A25]|nr:unnamed protein product [Amoebophrya sp. A25]|eukprot:GSA25T00018117001.1
MELRHYARSGSLSAIKGYASALEGAGGHQNLLVWTTAQSRKPSIMTPSSCSTGAARGTPSRGSNVGFALNFDEQVEEASGSPHHDLATRPSTAASGNRHGRRSNTVGRLALDLEDRREEQWSQQEKWGMDGVVRDSRLHSREEQDRFATSPIDLVVVPDVVNTKSSSTSLLTRSTSYGSPNSSGVSLLPSRRRRTESQDESVATQESPDSSDRVDRLDLEDVDNINMPQQLPHQVSSSSSSPLPRSGQHGTTIQKSLSDNTPTCLALGHVLSQSTKRAGTRLFHHLSRSPSPLSRTTSRETTEGSGAVVEGPAGSQGVLLGMPTNQVEGRSSETEDHDTLGDQGQIWTLDGLEDTRTMTEVERDKPSGGRSDARAIDLDLVPSSRTTTIGETTTGGLQKTSKKVVDFVATLQRIALCESCSPIDRIIACEALGSLSQRKNERAVHVLIDLLLRGLRMSSHLFSVDMDTSSLTRHAGPTREPPSTATWSSTGPASSGSRPTAAGVSTGTTTARSSSSGTAAIAGATQPSVDLAELIRDINRPLFSSSTASGEEEVVDYQADLLRSPARVRDVSTEDHAAHLRRHHRQNQSDRDQHAFDELLELQRSVDERMAQRGWIMAPPAREDTIAGARTVEPPLRNERDAVGQTTGADDSRLGPRHPFMAEGETPYNGRAGRTGTTAFATAQGMAVGRRRLLLSGDGREEDAPEGAVQAGSILAGLVRDRAATPAGGSEEMLVMPSRLVREQAGVGGGVDPRTVALRNPPYRPQHDIGTEVDDDLDGDQDVEHVENAEEGSDMGRGHNNELLRRIYEDRIRPAAARELGRARICVSQAVQALQRCDVPNCLRPACQALLRLALEEPQAVDILLTRGVLNRVAGDASDLRSELATVLGESRDLHPQTVAYLGWLTGAPARRSLGNLAGRGIESARQALVEIANDPIVPSLTRRGAVANLGRAALQLVREPGATGESSSKRQEKRQEDVEGSLVLEIDPPPPPPTRSVSSALCLRGQTVGRNLKVPDHHGPIWSRQSTRGSSAGADLEIITSATSTEEDGDHGDVVYRPMLAASAEEDGCTTRTTEEDYNTIYSQPVLDIVHFLANRAARDENERVRKAAVSALTDIAGEAKESLEAAGGATEAILVLLGSCEHKDVREYAAQFVLSRM